jgi:glycosyltransferase involved in cell wall biosynthesis
MIKAFPKHRNLLEEKMRIYPHDLSHLFFEGTSQKQNLAPTENTLVFIGAIGEIKGAPLIYESIPALLKEGFSIKILGKIHPYSPQKLKHVELLPYKNLEQLKSLLSALNPRFVAFPSVCAETFCYAFYEALVYAPGAVPIVGPYGNPAQVTQKHGIGVVMSEPSSSALLESCSIARQNYPALIKVKSAFVESLASQENDYYKDYSSMLLIANRASEPTLPTTQGAKILLESLNRIDEAGRIALGEFQELSLIHKKPFVQFAVRLHCFIKGVERQIRHFRKRIF